MNFSVNCVKKYANVIIKQQNKREYYKTCTAFWPNNEKAGAQEKGEY